MNVYIIACSNGVLQQAGIRDAGLEGRQIFTTDCMLPSVFVVRSVYKQLGVFINMLFTVIGCFAFGYFASYYSSYRPETVSLS